MVCFGNHQKRRFWTAIAASAAIVIGVFTGQPTYLLVDVAAVLITLSVCWPKKKLQMFTGPTTLESD